MRSMKEKTTNLKREKKMFKFGEEKDSAFEKATREVYGKEGAKNLLEVNYDEDNVIEPFNQTILREDKEEGVFTKVIESRGIFLIKQSDGKPIDTIVLTDQDIEKLNTVRENRNLVK